jgi:hypothetical protein
MSRRTAVLAVPLLLAAMPALPQITSVPMNGAGNEWVKALELRGRMDWEWIETYPEVVYFATRHEAVRKGDVVSMWMRIEYKHPQSPLEHRSALSHDDWDCAKKLRSTAGVFFYKFSNLQTDRPEPEHSTNLLRNWEKVQAGTVGETLLNFACSIQNVTPVIPEPKGAP